MKSFLVIVLSCLAYGLGWCPVPAAEPCRLFLEALRENQYYDVALDYLEQMRTSPLAPAQFKELIDYEKATIWIAGARHLAGEQREQQLDRAQESLKAFLKDHPQHPLLAGAQSQLAEVMVERGRIKREEAIRTGQSAEAKEKLLGEARSFYQAAQKAFVEVQKQFAEAERQLEQADPKNAQAIEQREVLRRDLLHARLAGPGLLYDLAQTYESENPQRKESLETAAQGFEKVFDQYKPLPAAYYAKLGEARCWRDLGEVDKAMATLQPVVQIQDSRETFRAIRSRALILTLEIYLLPSVKKYKEAVTLSQAWLTTARAVEQQSEEGTAIKYLSGVAWLEVARSAKAEEKTQAVENAKRLFSSVARNKSDYQQLARARQADPVLGGKASAKEPASFVEAEDRAQEALDRMVALQAEAKKAAEKGVKNKNRAEIIDAREEAFRYFQMALALAGKTPGLEPSELNRARYCLAYLYWDSNQSWEAAVLGEFLASHYPKHSDAAQAAKIALASYLRLFTLAAPGEDRQFELSHMQSIARLIDKHWPGQSAAEEAWLTLVRSALQSGENDQALEYLKFIKKDSSRRVEADLLAGQASWAKYAKARQLPAETRPKPEELNELIAQAEAKLKSAAASMKEAASEGSVPPGLVSALLALAQVSLINQQPAEAVKLLEDPKFGPLSLLSRQDPAASEGNMPLEIYKVALQAYVGAQQLDKAEELMKAMEKSVDKQDAEGSNRLMQIYLRLGQEIQGQLKSLREAQKVQEVADVSRGLERFLAQIAARDQDSNFRTLGWVAETFRSLGEGLDPGGSKLPAEARNHYQQAVKAYQRLLQRCQEDPKFAPTPESVSAFKVRLSFCLRRLGQYKEALDLVCEILKVGMNVPAQVEAAYTYQAWGEEKPAYYDLAILGGRPQKLASGGETRLVWGWAKIAKMVQPYLGRDPRYKDIFFEARYNIPLCRVKSSVALEGQKKLDVLKDAERDITVLQMLYPDMGGTEWFAKFDALLKKIQQLEGLKPVGLPQKSPSNAASPQPAAKGK